MNISEIITASPAAFETDLQQRIYCFLKEKGVTFARVENDPARTMEKCRLVGKKLGAPIAKTLFLCNRQQTKFYLYLMPENKPFVTREFSKSLDIARVSFASEALLHAKLGVESGAATLLCLLLESAKEVQLVIDHAVLEQSYFGCTDGTYHCYMRLKSADVMEKIIPALCGNRKPVLL